MWSRNLNIIFIFIVCSYIQVFAQEPKHIEILNANSLEYDESLGSKAKRLIGNVEFKHDDVLMFCDSAYYFDDNRIDAFSHVRILQGDTLSLIGEELNYNGNTKKAVIKRNITMQDPTMKLTTQILFYDVSTGVANYNDGGKIINKENTLTSIYGYYFSKKKLLFFRNKVKLVTTDYTITCDTLKHNTSTEVSYFEGPTNIISKENTIYCENGWYNNKMNKAQFNEDALLQTKTQVLSGDSLFYDRNLRYGKAICNVFLKDSTEKMIVSGDFAEIFERRNYAYVTQHALMMQYDNTDTLFLHADTLVATNDAFYFEEKQKRIDAHQPIQKEQIRKGKSKQKLIAPEDLLNKADSAYLDSIADKHQLMRAFHRVKFFRKDMQGVCDSLQMTTADSLLKMFTAPVLWSEQNQLKAKQIDIVFFEGNVYRMKLNTNAFIISRSDSLRFNQIKGKTMNAYFLKNELDKIYVVGNGQTNYWISDENKKLIGANHAECSSMLIRIKDNEVKKITLQKMPDAKMSPIKDAKPELMKLEGFEWLQNLRPKNWQTLFNN
jgi:hypothetical protein